MMPVQKPGRSKQDYETPAEFLRKLPQMNWDLACTHENKKARQGICFPVLNSLAVDWGILEGNLWLNPPFGNIDKWVEKAAKTSFRGQLHMLIPASVGANWYRDFVYGKAMTIFLNGRLSFDGKGPFPKDCMLLVYGKDTVNVCTLWDWRKAPDVR